MVIELDPKKEAQLKEITQASGRSLTELLESAIDDIIRGQRPPSEKPRMTHAERMADIKRIQSLPLESPDDGFSGRDHDKVLYRKDW